jgi:thiol-disulfide isomerase/thioredoxin
MKLLVICFLLIFSTGLLQAGDLTGKEAPGFTAKGIDGKELNLSDYRGKVVLLDFWASWCVPCRDEFPFLIKFYRENQKEDFIILAVNIDDEIENMHKFVDKYFANHVFPIIYDGKKEIPPLYELESMPTTIFIDKTGIIRYVHTGFNDSRKKEFKEELGLLLHEKQE